MGKNNKGYSGGYSNGTVSAVSNVKLPDAVPCDRCGKKKGHHCYSAKRLTDLKDHVRKNARFDPAKQSFVNCMMCSGAGAQQLEIDCIGCERTLPHLEFNKTQRRNPDHARCHKCQAKHLQHEPGAEEGDKDGYSTGSDSSSGDYDDDVSTMAGTFTSMSMNGNSSSGGVALGGNTSVTNSRSITDGYSILDHSRTPSTSTRTCAAEVSSTNTNTTMRSGWTTTATHNSNVLPPSFNASAYGTPPHLRGNNAPSSTRSDAGSSGGGKFAKVRASDAVRRPIGRAPPSKVVQPAPAPGALDDDDIGVAPDDSDSD